MVLVLLPDYGSEEKKNKQQNNKRESVIFEMMTITTLSGHIKYFVDNLWLCRAILLELMSAFRVYLNILPTLDYRRELGIQA